MEAMQRHVSSGAPFGVRKYSRYLVHLVAAAVVTAVWLGAAPAFAQSCPGLGFSAVEVDPAGDAIVGNLKSGVSAVFTVGTTKVSCTKSTTGGVIPIIGSGNPADPVTGVLSAPTFTNSSGGACSTNVFGVTATTTTNSTNGSWSLDISCGGNATFHIPKAGAVTKTSNGCTITVAPNGPVWIAATWSNGPPHMLTINATVPISVTGGFGCPTSATSANFSAGYNITDATDPTQNVVATELP